MSCGSLLNNNKSRNVGQIVLSLPQRREPRITMLNRCLLEILTHSNVVSAPSLTLNRCQYLGLLFIDRTLSSRDQHPSHQPQLTHLPTAPALGYGVTSPAPRVQSNHFWVVLFMLFFRSEDTALHALPTAKKNFLLFFFPFHPIFVHCGFVEDTVVGNFKPFFISIVNCRSCKKEKKRKRTGLTLGKKKKFPGRKIDWHETAHYSGR